jgi:hypothetical protein
MNWRLLTLTGCGVHPNRKLFRNLKRESHVVTPVMVTVKVGVKKDHRERKVGHRAVRVMGQNVVRSSVQNGMAMRRVGPFQIGRNVILATDHRAVKARVPSVVRISVLNAMVMRRVGPFQIGRNVILVTGHRVVRARELSVVRTSVRNAMATRRVGPFRIDRSGILATGHHVVREILPSAVRTSDRNGMAMHRAGLFRIGQNEILVTDRRVVKEMDQANHTSVVMSQMRVDHLQIVQNVAGQRVARHFMSGRKMRTVLIANLSSVQRAVVIAGQPAAFRIARLRNGRTVQSHLAASLKGADQQVDGPQAGDHQQGSLADRKVRRADRVRINDRADYWRQMARPQD